MPKIKTRQKLSTTMMLIHGFLIVGTCGLWYPVYLAARRKRVQVTYVPDSMVPPRG
ncbi:hypothetical protein [Streptomyces sp. 6N106]|uniref:hypothetical protein n=1 Tax=Streptomyces sp. 6N106 TaxID=3457418 RepID=UPI003FCF1885